MKPLIGITTNFMMAEKGLLSGQERYFLESDYVKAIENVGGTCILFPHTSDVESFVRYLDLVDGIVISGGIDINPMFYGDEPMEKTGYFNTKQDFFDVELTKKAIQSHVPILGLSRGIQIINVALGGTLYQDVSYMEKRALKHMQESKRSEKSHCISIEKDSKLYEIFGEEKIFVNSFHHQAIKDIGKGLKVSARASDGVIEAVELEGEDFVMGVQWNPEFMADEYEEQEGIFKKFVEMTVQSSR
ncbi:putative glutamine amidotransferase [Peptoclostridium litorale DSM 5388]|uniref:Glutamine amidotransferase-like protein n=1 Tax=Peptoclostridium litorale DSM 5388 TaxID=1121324 RepID=A0A069R9Q2_PEPLI|nr:gamma-glutamyl-gamma-aminobutyrate hydrolase family protein [Peptoclostridium litorale]KDR93761.1 glutamine amidotransferase-like protein [Peptoclostridium litorale DSM 5388]SIN85343.1 putative glutamine amidotransferase [Peptoclostridium litorale DSM 5388]